MQDKFDLRRYLTENKATTVSRLVEDKEPEGVDYSDPTIICADEDHEVIAQGKGFNKEELFAAFDKLIEKDTRGAGYTHFDIDNRPIEGAVHVIRVSSNPEETNRKYGYQSYHLDRYINFEEAAAKVTKELTSECKPERLNDHVIGWIMVYSDHFRSGIFPMLDPEGVKMYIEADDALSNSINNFYKGSNYWGD